MIFDHNNNRRITETTHSGVTIRKVICVTFMLLLQSIIIINYLIGYWHCCPCINDMILYVHL